MSGDHRWRGYSHEELHTMINGGPGVATSHPLEDQWKRMSETLARIDTDLHDSLAKIGAGWEGSSADATQKALSPLAAWATDAQTASDTMKSSAELQATYISDARKKMPEPVPITTEAPDGWDIAKGVLTGPFGAADVIKQQHDHEAQEAAQDNAQAQAVKVMEDYQSSSEWNANTLGEFQEPPQVVIDTPPPAGTSNPNANVGYQSQQPGFTSGHTGTTTPSWTAPPTGPTTSQPPVVSHDTSTHTSWADPTPNKPPTTIPPSLPTPHDTGNPSQTRTGPGVPPVFTRPGTPSGGPGGGKLGGGAGKGLGGGKAFGKMSGALGSGNSAAGKAGMPGMADEMHANRGAGAGGSAGKAGAAGGAGAGAAGRGQGEGDEDIEHKSADYLVETDDVFGDERLVAPPVIGGAPEA